MGNRTLRIDTFEACAKTKMVDNVTMSTDLWELFCQGQYPNATCDRYFLLNDVAEVQAIPGLLSGVIKGEIKGERLTSELLADLFFTFSPSENLWGEYGSAGEFIEMKNKSSVAVQEASGDGSRHYSINDISTYFTLLVGIYFPSVTGRSTTAVLKGILSSSLSLLSLLSMLNLLVLVLLFKRTPAG